MITADFKLGDRVENSYGAHGTVDLINDNGVRVTFKDRGTWSAVYSTDWFKKWATMLKKIAKR